MSTVSSRDAWRASGILLVALLLLTFFLYQQPVLYLIGKWNELGEGEYGHGYLVLLISAYMIFYNRQRLVVLVPCPEYKAIVAVALASILWMMASLVDIEMLQPVGLLLLVLSIVWASLGIGVTRVLAFPVLYIGFAIPVWAPLAPILQELTADAVFWMVRVIEVPALRIENMIVLPSGKLSIEEACAGLRYLMAALALGAFFAYLNYITFYSRLIVVLVAAGAAVLANIVRVFIIVYFAYTTDMQHPLLNDHVNLGWYLFGGLIVFLLFFEGVLHRKYAPDSHRRLDSVEREQPLCDKGKWQYITFILIAVMFISAAPIIVFLINKQSQSDTALVQMAVPLQVGEWVRKDAVKDDWMPQYRGAIVHKMTYSDENNRPVHLYFGIYPKQSQGEELINDLNRISDDKVWHIGPQRAKQYNAGGQLVLEQLLEKGDGTQRLVWYWYHVAGQDTVNKYQAKALQVLGFLNGKRQASVVAIAARLDDEPDRTREILGQFIEEAGPSLIRVLDDK